MDCPKCNATMEEATYGRNMTIDRCTGCEGMWFDLGEAEQLKDKWMSEFLDTGNAKAGKANNSITDCACPRCGKTMEHIKDADQPHIGYEACAEHGMYFDAGEFTDFKHETLFEKIRLQIDSPYIGFYDGDLVLNINIDNLVHPF